MTFPKAKEEKPGSGPMVAEPDREEIAFEQRVQDRTNELAALNEKLKHEISERIRAEEALKKSRDFLQSIVDAIPTPIFVKDKNGLYQLINKSYERFHGRGKNQVIGRNVYDLYPRDLAGKYDAMDRVVARGEHLVQQDFETVTKSGDIRNVSKIKSALNDPQGNYSGIVGVIFDITQRKMSEKALIQAKEEWERTFDTVPDLIGILDGQCRFKRVNRAMAERLGVSTPEIVGRTCYELIMQRHKPCKKCPHLVLLEDRQEHVVETRLENLGGDFIISISPLYSPDNELIGSLYIARDVTARKRAEDALQKAHDELEKRVRERTAELAARNEELKHEITERKSAEKAVQSRLLALTSPGRIPDKISYTDLFTVQELQTIQNAFANATNVASIITDPDGRPITQPSNFCRLCQDIIRPSKKGGANCMRSDALIGRPNPYGPIMQPCLSGGLWDGGASICVGDQHIASWLAGQIRDDSMTNDQIIKYAREIGTDEDEMIEALAEVPVMPKQQFARICQALFLIANQMSQLALQNVLQARAIVARQEAEEALRQSENRLQQLSANLIIAQEEERKRLAAELHDGIGQSLTAAKYGIDSVLQSIPKNDHLRETLVTAADVMKNVIHDVRKMQTELRPQVLDDLGIVATINWFCREYQTIFSQISIIKQINISETAIPAALKPVIYRIMQEAMNNIAKHSGASTVHLDISGGRGDIILSISDNGHGFDLGATSFGPRGQGGLGLDSMRERAELSRGSFSIQSGPERGTLIKVRWPRA